MPRLTCITTTFNEGPALLTSVRSVLAQSFGDFQFLIVDDGSQPETRAVLDGLRDPRLLVIAQANDGLSSARNKALEQATGDYVCFLDADDMRPNWAFAAINRAIEAHQPDLILSPGILHDVRGEIMGFYDSKTFAAIHAALPGKVTARGEDQFDTIRYMAQRLEPQSANKVVRRDMLKRRGIGFPNTHFFEDIFFHTGVLAAADRIAFLDTPTFTYFRRYLKPQITSTSGDMRFDIIPVTKLTLETLSRRPEFRDPAYRMAVLASCLKIVKWCETTISHHHRPAFHEAVRAMLHLIDPAYLDLPSHPPAALGDPEDLRDFLSATGMVV